MPCVVYETITLPLPMPEVTPAPSDEVCVPVACVTLYPPADVLDLVALFAGNGEPLIGGDNSILVQG